MPRTALAAPTVMMTLKTVTARLPARELIDRRNDQEHDELLRIDEAGTGIGRERRRHQRPGGIDQERPEETRGIPSLLTHQQRPGPARQHQRKADARGGNRELQRRDEAEKSRNGRPFEAVPGWGAGNQRQGRHDCDPKCATSGALRSPVPDGPSGAGGVLAAGLAAAFDSARSAASTTVAEVKRDRHRKSPCTHTR